MKFSLRSYATYSIGCLVVWAVLLAIVGFTGTSHKKNDVLLVALGWAIGWLSATIARAYYPPTKRQRKVAEAPESPTT